MGGTSTKTVFPQRRAKDLSACCHILLANHCGGGCPSLTSRKRVDPPTWSRGARKSGWPCGGTNISFQDEVRIIRIIPHTLSYHHHVTCSVLSLPLRILLMIYKGTRTQSLWWLNNVNTRREGGMMTLPTNTTSSLFTTYLVFATTSFFKISLHVFVDFWPRE
jgi:hypothetical protein